MRFAISIPQYARDSRFDEAAFRSHLRSVEELGVFESGWVQEQVIGAAGVLAALQTLTYAAACTERLRLGCAVFVLPLHNPLHLAKAISSLDCLSHGRVEVGVATGGRERPFAAFGVDPDKPVARFNEALALMKSCWTDAQIDFEGRFWTLHGATMEPKPVQKPYPPILLGAHGPKALERVARTYDGWMPLVESLEQFKGDVINIRKLAKEHGRDPDSLQITAIVDPDVRMPGADDLKRYRDAGASRLIPFSQKMGSDSAAGKAQEQLRQFASLVEIGKSI